MLATDTRQLRRLARQTFGFQALRPGQEEAIRAAAAGRDVLAVLPTGAGKSAIYQLAALIIPRRRPSPRPGPTRSGRPEPASSSPGWRMRAYAEARGCRRQVLLNYFGEPLDDPCGTCDRCAAGPEDAGSSGEPFPVHSQVSHATWGPGQVLGYEGDTVTVFFQSEGYKTLALELVEAGGLLTPAS